MIVPNLCFFLIPDKGWLKVSNLFVSIFVFLWVIQAQQSMKCYLESNSKTYMFSKLSSIFFFFFFSNPSEFACFIPSMVQNNMLSTKMKIKSKWIKCNWIQKYERRPLGLKYVWPQCLFSKDEGVFGKIECRNWNCKWKRVD